MSFGEIAKNDGGDNYSKTNESVKMVRQAYSYAPPPPRLWRAGKASEHRHHGLPAEALRVGWERIHTHYPAHTECSGQVKVYKKIERTL